MNHLFFPIGREQKLKQCTSTSRRVRKLIAHLFAFVMHNAFRVFEHLLAPQLEEVVGVRVEFKTILAIVSIAVEFVQRWRFIALLQQPRNVDVKWSSCGIVANKKKMPLTKYVSSIGAGIVARENIC